MFKRFMRSNAVQITIGWLVAAYMTLVKYTTRWEVERADHVQEIIDNGKGVIALVWHSRFMMLTSAWKKEYQLPYVLVSRSRDGAIVTHTSHFLGLKTIRGSAKKAAKGDLAAKAKGGAKASMDIVTALENDGCIVVTPDGPRGPRQRLGDGPIRLARLTGAPLMPCTFAVRNRKQFDSWDKLVLPLPFGKGKIIWGTPVMVPANADERKIEHIRERIEDEMNIFLADADRAMGHDPVQAADK
ncbi:lysophospholipid acyltransferase family protein [Hellea sp.]|nr:lysophospholipid acyltransferase family protein [Hellea sp.]